VSTLVTAHSRETLVLLVSDDATDWKTKRMWLDPLYWQGQARDFSALQRVEPSCVSDTTLYLNDNRFLEPAAKRPAQPNLLVSSTEGNIA
jgi:hypothetical protein